jgi:hypothetical protein
MLSESKVGTTAVSETRQAFGRLIATIRAAEVEVAADLMEAQRLLNGALQENARLRDRLRDLENEARQYRP